MILYKTTIPINPKTKKNSMQMITKPRPRLIQSKAYREYEKDCLTILKRPSEPLNGELHVMAKYYRGTAHRCDITNLNGALHDILTKAQLIKDDNFKIVKSTDGSRVYIDRENPRTEVTIFEYEGD